VAAEAALAGEPKLPWKFIGSGYPVIGKAGRKFIQKADKNAHRGAVLPRSLRRNYRLGVAPLRGSEACIHAVWLMEANQDVASLLQIFP